MAHSVHSERNEPAIKYGFKHSMEFHLFVVYRLVRIRYTNITTNKERTREVWIKTKEKKITEQKKNM